MIRNYLSIAYRNLVKNKVFSLINIFGLAFGLTSTIFILLWVHNELSWDRFNTGIDRIYRVFLNRPGDNGIYTQTVVPLALWDALKTTTGTQFVSPTNTGADVLLTYKDVHIEKPFLYAGEDFLKMFNFKLIEGSSVNQLNDASSIVLTRSTAKALFGTESAVGKDIRLDNRTDLTVSGVVEDPPQNSSLQFDCLIPFQVIISSESSYKDALTNWKNSSFNMYVQLEKGTDPAVFESRVRELINSHTGQTNQDVMIFPLQRYHLYSKFENGKSVGGSIIYVKIFSIVALLILALACINFINLATARSEKRAKEVGIRKTIGSSRTQLILQFLSETLAISLIAFILSVLLVVILLPYYNNLVNKNLHINFHSPILWVLAAGFVILTGLFSGSYPAFFLSSFRPIAVLKKSQSSGRQLSLPRKIMLTTQFFFSIGLIICTLIIYSQIFFIKDHDIGYDKNNLIMVPVTGDIQKNYNAIKYDLTNKALASSVSISSAPLTNVYAWSKLEWQGQREDQKTFFGIIAIGYDYTKTTGANILQGRDFDALFSDSSSVILNQASVDYMELKDPVGAKIRLSDREYTVVGVMDNMVMMSPYEPGYRSIFLFDQGWTNDVIIRLSSGEKISASLKEIEGVFKTYNPEFPFSYSFVDEEFSKKFENEELIGRLANIFAILAIVISTLGLFGLASYAAEQRTREVGIRKVFGASIMNIVSMFSVDFTKFVLLAFLLSAPITWWIMRKWLTSFAYHVSIHWWVIAGAGLFTLLLTWIIVSVQAIRAATVNPTQSLRIE